MQPACCCVPSSCHVLFLVRFERYIHLLDPFSACNFVRPMCNDRDDGLSSCQSGTATTCTLDGRSRPDPLATGRTRCIVHVVEHGAMQECICRESAGRRAAAREGSPRHADWGDVPFINHPAIP